MKPWLYSFLSLFFLASSYSAELEKRPFTSLLVSLNNPRETQAWREEILGDVDYTEADTLKPDEWNKFSLVVLAAGKSTERLTAESSEQVRNYLEGGGVIIAVGPLPLWAQFEEGARFSAPLPAAVCDWVGAKRVVYPSTPLGGYGAPGRPWPWKDGFPFEEKMFGVQPYALMDLIGAVKVVGSGDNAIVAVNKVGKGAFIFVGVGLSFIKTQDAAQQADHAAVYIKAMKSALEATRAAGR